MKSPEALLNRIIESSFIDGPGNRMVLFLQGCNMRCLYCHNPETQRACSGCGQCVKSCPAGALTMDGGKVAWNKDKCRDCGTCLKKCGSFSSPKYQRVTVDSIHDTVRRAEDFMDGVTVSGGECTLQWQFIRKLFSRLKKDTSLTTFIDSNGLIPAEALDELMPVTDGFMMDLKCWNPQRHRELTGTGNSLVIENIEKISTAGKLYEVRTVMVEGFTDSRYEIESIASYVKNLNESTKLKLIPFRPQGVKGVLQSCPPFDGARYHELCQVAEKILGKRVTRVMV